MKTRALSALAEAAAAGWHPEMPACSLGFMQIRGRGFHQSCADPVLCECASSVHPVRAGPWGRSQVRADPPPWPSQAAFSHAFCLSERREGGFTLAVRVQAPCASAVASGLGSDLISMRFLFCFKFR